MKEMSWMTKPQYDNLLEKLGLDRNQLKKYKIIDKQLSPQWESYIETILDDERYWESAQFRTPSNVRIESGGDSRCSGKSQILWLLFPDRLSRMYRELGEEEEPLGESRNKGIFSILKPYNLESEQDLAIYVKRPEIERVKCIIKHRKSLPEEAVIEEKEDREAYRKIQLEEINLQPNYIVFENLNEEQTPTMDDICNNVETLITEIEQYTERGFDPDPLISIRIPIANPYLKKCKLEERMLKATKSLKLKED